jgi:hypothetical protein
VLAILAEADGRPEHIVRLTWYIVDKQEYLACNKELGSVYRALFFAGERHALLHSSLTSEEYRHEFVT